MDIINPNKKWTTIIMEIEIINNEKNSLVGSKMLC